LSDKYNSIVGSEEDGQYVTSSLSSSDKVLFQMAHTTGGIFRKAYDYGSLMQVYDEIDKLEKIGREGVEKELDKEYLYLDEPKTTPHDGAAN
jgi:hypothetical protein